MHFCLDDPSISGNPRRLTPWPSFGGQRHLRALPNHRFGSKPGPTVPKAPAMNVSSPGSCTNPSACWNHLGLCQCFVAFFCVFCGGGGELCGIWGCAPGRKFAAAKDKTPKRNLNEVIQKDPEYFCGFTGKLKEQQLALFGP